MKQICDCLLGCLAILVSGLSHAAGGDSPSLGSTHNPVVPEMSSLNIRLSNRAIHPPEELIKKTLTFKKIQAARPRVGPSPNAAILEDDNRQRVVVLSPQENGGIQADFLVDLDINPHIPILTQCTQQRQCAFDRRPMTGGLGCVAMCLREVLNRVNQQ